MDIRYYLVSILSIFKLNENLRIVLGQITVSTKRKYTLAAKPSTQNRGGLEEK